ncbi:MAG TPA: acyl-CoA dehydrogenase family protein [Actinomycetes bacterium]|nr:acyl-CoA dehydrogenase family protein [Actinomycetes bacterium]
MTRTPMTARTASDQTPPPVGWDLFGADPVLPGALRDGDAGWAEERLHALGVLAGSEEALGWARQADRNPPVLHTHDAGGRRVDEVDFDPAWHRLLEVAIGRGLAASPWRDPRPGAHVARAAAFHVWHQLEAGHGCPVSMTYAAVPALRAEPELAAAWEPLLTSLAYDPGLRPPQDKRGALCGMTMTERQGGSDLRATTTRAEPLAGGEGAYRLRGHKWFCSAPMCDAFLTLAQAPGGLTCFLLPRVLPDGTRNGLRIQRLKDKLGNRANASAEIELAGARAARVGPEGRGIATIIEMVAHTRLDCAVGSAGLMRQALAQAAHRTARRQAFGRRLADQPLMRNVLADLEIEAEAATLLACRVARAFDRAGQDEREAGLRRIGTAVAKYWVCKRAPAVVGEALECLGGDGYVEDGVLPRLYREAPLNSIWEGAGNVNCLDVLRAAARRPASVQALLDEAALARGADRRLDAALAALSRELADPREAEARARRMVERMALVLQGSLLVRHGDPAVADAFCASRLTDGGAGAAFGTLPAGVDHARIAARALPA